MGGELIYHIESEYHTQSKTVCQNLRLFVILHSCVYFASLGSQTHDLADLEKLSPGGQNWL